MCSVERCAVCSVERCVVWSGVWCVVVCERCVCGAVCGV